MPFAPVDVLYEVDVAPAMFVNVMPTSVEICHWTLGVGKPLAAAVNVADAPAHTVWFDAAVVIAGAWLTVSVKVCVAVPALFVAVNVIV